MKSIGSVIDKVNQESLKTTFMEACSNKDFKDFVYSLGINEETLMKYTSSLEDSFLEYENCRNCKDLSCCSNQMKGYRYTPEEDGRQILFSYIACPQYNAYLEKNSYTKNIEFFRLPKELQEASFKNIYKDDKARLPIIKYFKEFMEGYVKEKKGKGLYLTGSFGSGKTYLIASLFNELAKKGNKSALVYFPELLRSLKSSFGSDYEERFSYIKKVPLLLLDDIGAENVTPWGRDEVLGPILQYRMDENLPTFFTSNLTLLELENNLSVTASTTDKVKARRIVERIKYLSVDMSLVSENRRK